MRLRQWLILKLTLILMFKFLYKFLETPTIYYSTVVKVAIAVKVGDLLVPAIVHCLWVVEL